MVGMLAFLAQAGENNNGDGVDVTSILGYIVVGAIVGVLARFLVPGDDPMGIIGTILLGIVGAVIGGWLAGEVFKDTSGVDWIASIVVAVILVIGYRAIAGNRGRVNS
ncbi:MAG: GlsB/YeaQ/YmgE family stress response membrane protein [Actinomycetota bacterium]